LQRRGLRTRALAVRLTRNLHREFRSLRELRPRFEFAARVERFDLARVQAPQKRDSGVGTTEDFTFAVGDDALPTLRDVVLCASESKEVIAWILAGNDQFVVMLGWIVLCGTLEVRLDTSVRGI
jgi:hypothetical protein